MAQVHQAILKVVQMAVKMPILIDLDKNKFNIEKGLYKVQDGDTTYTMSGSRGDGLLVKDYDPTKPLSSKNFVFAIDTDFDGKIDTTDAQRIKI